MMSMRTPPGFWILAASEGFLSAGYAMSFPFLAVYLSQYRHLSMAIAGLFLSFSLFMTSFAHVIGGELSDAFGRKKVMVAALMLRALLIGAMAWIIRSGGSLPVLLAIHPLGLFIGSFYNPAARAWVADSTPRAGRMKFYGFLRIGTNVGWALGPAVGGFMASGSYALMFGATGLSFLLCGLIVLLFIRDADCFEARRCESANFRLSPAALRSPEFRDFCVYSFVIAMVMSQLVVSTSLYATAYLGLTERQVGLLFSLNGVMVVSLQYCVTRLLEKFPITAGLAAGALFYAAGYFTVGYSGAFLSALIGVAVLTVGEVAVSPGMQALGANIAPKREKGRYLGVHGLFQQAGSSAGVLVGTNAINFISPHYRQGPWLIVVCLALIAAAGFRSLGRRLDPGVNGLREEAVPPPLESPETI